MGYSRSLLSTEYFKNYLRNYVSKENIYVHEISPICCSLLCVICFFGDCVFSVCFLFSIKRTSLVRNYYFDF